MDVTTERPLDWTHEDYPGDDSTGTIAESWFSGVGHYAARIDRFTDAEGGGFAYTVCYYGCPVRNGENEPAGSFAEALGKVIELVG